MCAWVMHKAFFGFSRCVGLRPGEGVWGRVSRFGRFLIL